MDRLQRERVTMTITGTRWEVNQISQAMYGAMGELNETDWNDGKSNFITIPTLHSSHTKSKHIEYNINHNLSITQPLLAVITYFRKIVFTCNNSQLIANTPKRNHKTHSLNCNSTTNHSQDHWSPCNLAMWWPPGVHHIRNMIHL